MDLLPLDESYFLWLCNQVGSADHKDESGNYWKLLKLLYTKEFVWFVPNDDNRAEDGRDLRHEFLETQNVKVDHPYWLRMSCDMLELLIGLSRRLAFESDGESAGWFWHLIHNLGLSKYRDGSRINKTAVNNILDEVIWRTYEPDGRGGLFPLKDPQEDQRDVELWYQLCSYLLEHE